MVRSKIKYEFIGNERTRRQTFKKRRSSVFKKLKELKTLCGIETCAIVTHGDKTEFEVWPSSPVTTQIVQKFMNLPTSSRTTHMVDQVRFLKEDLSRISRNSFKEEMRIRSLERELLLVECLTKEDAKISNANDLNEMLRMLDKKIDMVNCKIAEVEPSRAGGAKGRNNESYHGKGKQHL